MNDWAEGKMLLVGTSLAAPGDHGPGSCHDRDASGWICASTCGGENWGS